MSLARRLRARFGRPLRADPEEAPPDDPRRSPDWCHSHGKWRQEEEGE